jgi:hypothetical protein
MKQACKDRVWQAGVEVKGFKLQKHVSRGLNCIKWTWKREMRRACEGRVLQAGV